MAPTKFQSESIKSGERTLYIRTFKANDQRAVFSSWAAGARTHRTKGSMELLVVVLGACMTAGLLLRYSARS